MTQDSTLVSSVLDVSDLILLRTQPPTLFMRASGIVPTSGWSNPQLVPVEYATPPADGIQDFDFVAVPPDGIVLPVLSPIKTEVFCPNVPEWARGVRVKARDNDIEAMFPTPAETVETDMTEDLSFAVERVDDGDLPMAEPIGVEEAEGCWQTRAC